MAGGDAPSPRRSAPEAKAAAVWPSCGACCPHWSSYRPRAMSSGPVPEGALGPGWLLLQSCSHHWEAAEGLPQLLCDLVRDKQVPAAPNEQRQWSVSSCLPVCPTPAYGVTSQLSGHSCSSRVCNIAQGYQTGTSTHWGRGAGATDGKEEHYLRGLCLEASLQLSTPDP